MGIHNVNTEFMKQIPFLDLFRVFIKYYSETAIEYEKRDADTLQAYANKYRLVNDFLFKISLVKVKAVDFTVIMADDLLQHLSASFSHNYSVRIVDLCRQVLDFGARKNHVKYNPLGSWKMLKTKPSEPVHLVPSEIILLEKYTPIRTIFEKGRYFYMVSIPRQSKKIGVVIKKIHSAAMFLSQCYTGFDYGDIIRVREHHIISYINREYLKMKREKKSGGISVIPYFDETRRLFERYSYNMGLLCNPRYNEYIKYVAKECGIRKHLTTHVGRKTFAMIKLNHEGYSLESVSGMLGHKSVKTTEQHYARVDINLISRELTKLGR